MLKWWPTEMGLEEERRVLEVLRSHYVNEGEVTEAFEKKISELVDCPYAISTTSGTSALYLSLAALGIGPGDEVIVPDITFIATANAVHMTGAKVILCDVDPSNLLMDPKKVERLITPRTKALMPVHISGRFAPLNELLDLAKTYHLKIVEDAAEAFGSKHEGRALGTIGDAGAFSFSANKVITMGQGGIVLTRDAEIAKRVRMLKDQGREKRGTGGDDIHHIAATNSKLTNLQAAVGLGQLERIQERWSRLKKNHEIYLEELHGLRDLKILPFDLKAGHQPLWTDVLAERRDELDATLAATGFECRKFWHPLHRQTPYRLNDLAFPVSTQQGIKALWLPSSFKLKDETILEICKTIRKFYESRPHHLEKHPSTSSRPL
jgi:perosamine synthetase